MKNNSRNFLIVLLGSLAAFGPLVTDMYLPGLPAMTVFFGTTVSMVQLGITTSMLGLALGQLLIVPLSDRYGRRLPLLISLWLFVLSTFMCIMAWDIHSFIVFRLLQGIAGAGGIVLSRSVSADLFSGRELGKFFAVIAAVMGLAPVIAPVLGGLVLKFTVWHGVFRVLLGIGVLLLVCSYFLKETLPSEKRVDTGLVRTFALYVPVLRNRKFMMYVVLLSFAMAVMFAFIAASPFLFQQHYNMSELVFGFFFGLYALAVTVGSIVSSRFGTPPGLWLLV